MIRRPPRSTRTDTLFPDTTLFRSCGVHSKDTQLDGSVVRHQFYQRPALEVGPDQEIGLQNDPLMLQCRGAAGVAAVGVDAWVHSHGDCALRTAEHPIVACRPVAVGEDLMPSE